MTTAIRPSDSAIAANPRGSDEKGSFAAVFPVASSPTGEGMAATPAPNTLRGVSVLVIDDECDARELVALLLGSYGAEVFVADSAEAALEVLKDHSPSVLVSDIGMPVTDGYALIGRVRALDNAVAKTPAIALTAFARDKDRRRALDAGFHSYLTKPAEPEVLVRMVGELAHAPPGALT